jgi:hypothetical protein
MKILIFFFNFCKEESLIDKIQLKLENIENEIDLRVESLVAEIHNYGEKLRLQLNNNKMDFQKYVFFLNIIMLNTIY